MLPRNGHLGLAHAQRLRAAADQRAAAQRRRRLAGGRTGESVLSPDHRLQGREHMASREDAQAVFARMLMQKIREDKHPSTTHMALLEQFISRDLLEDYIAILLEKIGRDPAPSIPMMHRVYRLTEAL
jgi:hypothetical protein